MILLWQYLGPSALAGMAILILMSVINMFLGLKIRNLQVRKGKYKFITFKLDGYS